MVAKSKVRLIYSTFPNRKAAEDVAVLLVKAKLAACVNLMPLTAVYSWQGKLTRSREVAVVIKTSDRVLKRALAFVKTRHPYDCPCLMVIRPGLVNRAYDKWVRSQVAK